MSQPKSSSRSLTVALFSLALAVPAFAGTAFADVPSPPVATPEALGDVAGVQARPARQGSPVSVVGEVARYVVGPLGHVRGFVLKDGTAVMVHDTAGDAMSKTVAVGESVRVEGWSPTASGGKQVMRAAVFGPHGQVVTPQARGSQATAPRDPSAWQAKRAELKAEVAKLPEASANGTVQSVIYGHHGKVEAVVLTNGTSAFLRPSLAKQVATRGIRVGDQIQSSGRGASYPLVASVAVGSITFADGTHFEAGEGRAR